MPVEFGRLCQVHAPLGSLTPVRSIIFLNYCVLKEDFPGVLTDTERTGEGLEVTASGKVY